MSRIVCILLIIIALGGSLPAFAQDTVLIKGQVSAWGNFNATNDLPVWLGGRYIPTLQLLHKDKKGKLLDFEASANINGSAGFHPFDTIHTTGKIKPYRAWVRLSTDQLELRLGLQKINFGQASIIRPLMWFDQLDPRDPLQLTDGVWGLLGRYYFLNNANLWLWGLYGNNKAKAWEVGKTSKDRPEFGGRFQMPVPKGEAALSYHFRNANTDGLSASVPSYADIPENRLGFDAKWDLGVGLWFEGSWINKRHNIGELTNQEIFTSGIDYTFGAGNGLNVVYEQTFIAYDEKAFSFSEPTVFSAASATYPLGLSDNLSAMFYYDWGNQNLYSFINLKHQFNKFYVYLIAYSNPKQYLMPQQDEGGTLFSGRGFQIMFVYNH